MDTGRDEMMTEAAERPYIIYREPPGAGFWSNFSAMLQGIDDADQHGMIPVVDMERHPTRYNEDEPILGTKNAWEYYFLQAGGTSLSEALEQNAPSNQGKIAGRFTSLLSVAPPADLVVRGRELIRKHITVKPEILELANAIIPAGLHDHILGIHVRGTDMRQAIFPGHPIPDVTLAYLEKARSLDRTNGFSAIFLACDENETIDLFRKEFGPRLRVSNSHRTPAGTATSMDYGWLFESARNHHRYLLGREVLVDVLLLARCGHFICGMSNITHAAIYFSERDQVVHAMTPIWITPETDATEPRPNRTMPDCMPDAVDPLPVVLAQKLELYRLLMHTEDEAIFLRNELKSAQHQIADLHKKLARASKQADDASSGLARLEERMPQLVNKWTRLGWKLMPWTKPKWSQYPLEK